MSLEPSTTVATSLPFDDPKIKELAKKAVTQMDERRGGKHSLIHTGKGRKVAVKLPKYLFKSCDA